ncbi:MAG: energy-coupling factor transporter transmembrane protein EcfT [Clostridiales bacterium]|nr:energy-coupling factor transporter transmembrane protein EcfT [Clostridiales bacterium]
MTDISLGQFIPGNSCIHRLDPRTKILLMIAYIVMVFLVKSMVLYLVPLALIVLVLLLSRISLRYMLRSLRPIRWLLLFMFVLNIFFSQPENATVWWQWRFLVVTREGFLSSLLLSLRLIFLVTGTSLMTLTTSPIALTDGLERLLAPLRRLRFPAHELALMMTIALRFIPTLMEEADKIRKAQMARGADFESGNIIRRAKAMIPILVPLFVSALRRADELAIAMESRCYHGGEGRTRLHQLHFRWADLWAAGVVGVMIGFIIVVGRLM